MRIALIGFGEVGQIAAQELRQFYAGEIRAWDVLFPDPNSNPSKAIENTSAVMAENACDAVRNATLILSAVTAAQCVAAAEACVHAIEPGALFLDLNSASPGAKIQAAGVIDGAGGRYVEAALMSPIEPRRLASPMLLGGPYGQTFLDAVDRLGFTGAQVYSDELGKASATKLCRSVMVKGVEALLGESLLAARRYGVEDVVLASFSNILPLPDWSERAHYMISRSLEHGRRRAEEMREAARTVAEAGIEPMMSEAIADRQDWSASYRDAAAAPSLIEMLDRVLEAQSAAAANNGN